MEQTVWKIQADLNYQAFTSALFSDTSDTSLADLLPLPRKSEPTPAAPFATMLMTKRNLSAPTTLKLPSSPPSIARLLRLLVPYRHNSIRDRASCSQPHVGQ